MLVGNIRSLWDVPGLGNIRKVCSKHGVHFTAIGGLVRNLARLGPDWEHDPDARLDAFDLAPFLSDIDLLHTGPPGQTATLARALQFEIPFGECFRWQLRSITDNGDFWEAMKVNNVIPAATLTLSTNSQHGMHDRWNGADDLAAKRFRFIRNAYYTESPLFRKGRDLEVFSALLYYRILFESGVRSDELERQPGLQDALVVMHQACLGGDMLIRLEESAKLRMRLRYLAAVLGSAARPGQLRDVAEPLGLIRLWEYVGDLMDLEELMLPPETLAITAHLGGDTFRMPWSVSRWTAGEAALEAFDHLMGRVSAGMPETVISVGPGQEVLLVSDPYPLVVGVSQSSHTTEAEVNEFLHFSVPLQASDLKRVKGYGGPGLAVLMALRFGEGAGHPAVLLPVPSACWFAGDRLLVRINCGGLLERAPEMGVLEGTFVDVQFVVLGWEGVER